MVESFGYYVDLSNGEKIYIRVAGHGSKPVILVPGNNTSGKIFEPILSFVKSISEINDKYTFYTFDYRGSGRSSYYKKIRTLADFAADFNEIVQKDEKLRKGNITLVGYSMGFGVVIEMVHLDPEKYDAIISLAGMGSRGIRIFFTQSNAGVDPKTGKVYAAGDWVDSLSAMEFHQRSWQGKSRTFENVKLTWDMMVFNDILKYDPAAFKPKDDSFTNNPFYTESLMDVLSIQYMPESLYACHMFNSTDKVIKHINSNGDEVVISGSGKIKSFKGKRVLLIKARTDYAKWRGDLVVMDQSFQNTKYDLKRAEADVQALIIEPNIGFDHGFPITHPYETLEFIVRFIEKEGSLDRGFVDTLLGKESYNLYTKDDDSWEMEEYGSF